MIKFTTIPTKAMVRSFSGLLCQAFEHTEAILLYWRIPSRGLGFWEVVTTPSHFYYYYS
jgi:hypothetical protein